MLEDLKENFKEKKFKTPPSVILLNSENLLAHAYLDWPLKTLNNTSQIKITVAHALETRRLHTCGRSENDFLKFLLLGRDLGLGDWLPLVTQNPPSAKKQIGHSFSNAEPSPWTGYQKPVQREKKKTNWNDEL